MHLKLGKFKKLHLEFAKMLFVAFNSSINQEKRAELFTSSLDIKMYKEDGKYYYFVGNYSDGMVSSMPNAVLIRNVEGYNGAEVRFSELLPLMNVLFVHNERLTVIPFPFKYLREYVAGISQEQI